MNLKIILSVSASDTVMQQLGIHLYGFKNDN